MAIFLADNSPSSDPPADEAQDARRRRDPEATRQAILDAAQELFVCHGPAGTSLSAIAKKADVTKSLIHHHFGSKEELWLAVEEYRFRAYFDIQRKMLLESDSTADLLRDSITAYFRFLQSEPDSVRFLMWHMLEDEEQPCPNLEKELFELGIEKIREAQDKGEIRSDLEPFFIIKSLLALPMGWFQTRCMTQALIDSDISAERLDEMYLEDMVKHFLEGVRPRPEDDSDPMAG
ncbi:MAG: TetR/AcrR family transcriptional regulator [Thermoanaerobaculia bacterium]|nr:TetR/AcrR family transcriptional regulator [Thermoanaerobaculia bacterium]